jgi:methyltransferase
MMLGEQAVSRSNERKLRRAGAVEPTGDVYRTMAWTYPLMFVAMAAEGVIAGRPWGVVNMIGLAMFLAAKVLKFWAIAALGPRWTFRVLVPPGAPLVSGGPYAWMRHPNYVGVFGEIIGAALLVGGFATGALSLIGFGMLIRKRIAVEEEALSGQG